MSTLETGAIILDNSLELSTEFTEPGARVAYNTAASVLSKFGVADPLKPGAFVFQSGDETVRINIRVLAFPRSIIVESKGEFSTVFPQLTPATRAIASECRRRVLLFLAHNGIKI